MNSIPLSMINEAIKCQKSINDNLFVGLCGTQYVGSDSYAMVIREILSPKKVKVSHIHSAHLNYILTNDNDIEYLPEEYLKEYEKFGRYYKPMIFTLRKNGRWIEEGHNLWKTGGIHFGHAEEYRDPSF